MTDRVWLMCAFALRWASLLVWHLLDSSYARTPGSQTLAIIAGARLCRHIRPTRCKVVSSPGVAMILQTAERYYWASTGEYRKHYTETGSGPHLPIIPFYKRGCQDKYLLHDGKTAGKWSCHPAPVMEGGAVSFPLPQIHCAFVTTPISSQRRQAERLCSANHGSI